MMRLLLPCPYFGIVRLYVRYCLIMSVRIVLLVEISFESVLDC